MTSENPYPCRTGNVRSLIIDKSLSLVSYGAPAHLSCSGGITIGSKAKNTQVTVALQGLAFNQTHLDFQGHFLKIADCSFKDSFKPMSVVLNEVSSVTKVSLTNSLVIGSIGCLLVDIHSGSSYNTDLLLSIWNTTFHRNEAISSEHFRGILSIRDVSNSSLFASNSTSATFSISVHHVMFYQNKGRIIEVLLPGWGVTKEVYEDIHFVGNEAVGNSSTTASLYTSQASSSTVEFHRAIFKDNEGIRCMNISSPRIVLKVKECLFSGKGSFGGDGGAMNIVAHTSLELFITDSRFLDFNSKLSNGGALYVYSRKMNTTLNNVSFVNCTAVEGAALYIWGDEEGFFQALKIDKVRVFHCSCTYHMYQYRMCGTFYLIAKGSAAITVVDSLWQKNNKYCAVSALGGEKAKISLSNVQFIDNFAIALQLSSFGKVDVTHSVVSSTKLWRQGAAVILQDVTSLSLEHVTFKENAGRALQFVASYNDPRVNVFIRFCVFNENSGGHLVLQGTDSFGQLLTFELCDSTFSGWPNGPVDIVDKACLICIFLGWYDVGQPTVANIMLSNVTLGPSMYRTGRLKGDTGQKRSAMFLKQKYGKSRVNVHINKSTFQNTHNEAYAAVAMVFLQTTPQYPGCKMTYPVWNQTNHVTVENTLFEGNTGSDAGAFLVQNANASLRNCKFKDNFSARGTHIYLAQGSASLDIDNTVFHQHWDHLDTSHFDSFIHSDSENSLVLRNTILKSDPVSDVNHLLTLSGGGAFSVDKSNTIMCSVGGMIILRNFTRVMDTLYHGEMCQVKVTIFTISCKICNPGYYSLQRGTSSGLSVRKDFVCHRCPYGATCTKNIKAKNGFWGSIVNPKNASLAFSSCPFGYCSSPPQRLLEKPVYNYCNGNRTGRLCGACPKGFAASLITSACIENTYCRPLWYIAVAAFLALLLAIYLVKRPPVLPFLIGQVLWFRQRPEINNLHSGNPATGYIKVLFYFYQVANLLLLEDTAINVLKTHYILSVTKLFNFQLSDREGRLSTFGCPISGLDAVMKELIPAVGVFCVFSCIVLVYCFDLVYRKIRGQCPSGASYTAAALETLLLGHVTLVNASLKLLNCVSVGSRRVLFIDGQIQCWQYWQTAMAVFTACYLIPFVVVLGISAKGLIRGFINVRQFLLGCVFPLPFVVYWFAYLRTKKIPDNQEQDESRKAILNVLTAPFRRATGNNVGTVYWESILIGRRLALVALHSFLSQHLPRYLVLQFVCLMLYVHHSSVNPYANSLTNRLESVSLISHVVIATFSVGQAALNSAGVVPEGPNETLFRVLDWIRAAILGLVPASFAILVLLTIVSLMIRFLYTVARYLYRYFVARYKRTSSSDENYTRLLEESLLTSSYSP